MTRPATRPFPRPVTHLAAALLAAPLLATPAQAQTAAASAQTAAQREALGDWLKVAAARLLLTTARSFADITFATSEVSPDSGGMVLTDLVVTTPDIEGRPRGCTVRVARAEVAFDVSLLSFGDVLVHGRDATASFSCLPPQMVLMLAMAGRQELRIEDLTLRTAYDLPSGALDYNVRLDAPELAEVAAEGRLDYVAVSAADDATPRVKFGEARVSVVDNGALGPASAILGGPAGVAAQAGGFVRGGLGQPALAQEVEREVERFLSGGGRLTLSVSPREEAWLDAMQRMQPAAIVALLRPQVGAAPRVDVPPPPVLDALAGAGDGAGEAAEPAQRLAAAEALLQGRGVPRNPRRAVALLEPLTQGDAERGAAQRGAAKALLARALVAQDRDAPHAYRLALDAGADGEPVRALLDRIERQLAAERVASAQNEALSAWSGRDAALADRETALRDGETRTLLLAAREHAEGTGRPRHFGTALTLAALAEAGGEVGAGGLVRDLERRMAGEAFADMLADARDRATDLWIERLAPVLARRAGERQRIEYEAPDMPRERPVVEQDAVVVPDDDAVVVPDDGIEVVPAD